MSETEVYAICDAGRIGKGVVMPFTLARPNANGVEEAFPILIGRDDTGQVFGYVNICPHAQGTLYGGAQPLEATSRALVCSQHGAHFETGSGLCTAGPCKGKSLQSIPVFDLDGDICIGGVTLIEEGEEGPPEVMITSE
jgi:nitrite reductase/ring-hydroxylating ferredoxin subunit